MPTLSLLKGPPPGRPVPAPQVLDVYGYTVHDGSEIDLIDYH
jgi:hypothetical protein